jgi:phosphoglycerol geranylgeranyltransferase
MQTRQRKPLMLALLDPDKITSSKAEKIIFKLESSKFDAYLIGGSTAIWQTKVDNLISVIKKVSDKPVIIFPGSISSLSPLADAVLFTSLLNSSNPFYIVEQQFQAAPIIKEMNLEPISTAYIILGNGGTAGFVGHARPIPIDKPELAAGYVLTAQYFGFKMVYLEAGSGATEPIPPYLVKFVKTFAEIPIIIGGGIKNAAQIQGLIDAGADCLIVGNVLENPYELNKFLKELEGVRGVFGDQPK